MNTSDYNRATDFLVVQLKSKSMEDLSKEKNSGVTKTGNSYRIDYDTILDNERVSRREAFLNRHRSLWK